MVKATVLGIERTIAIDDYLPFYKNSKSLMFDQISANNSLWGPFIEKVWAKAHGNYAKIEGGNADEVFQFLFGLPVTSLNRGDAPWYNATSIWNLVSAADKNNYIIWGAVSGSSSVNQYGLVTAHAYTILSSHIVYDSKKKEYARLFRVRNPWNVDSAFNGTWNDKSPLWNDTKNKFYSQVPYVNNSKDGIYFIE